MMLPKKIFFLSCAFFLLLAMVIKVSWAQTPTEKTEGEVKSQEDKIKDLKDRVATKVAEIKTVSVYQFLIGEVKSITDSVLILKTSQGEKKISLTEETKIFKVAQGKKSSLTFAKIKSGDRVSVVGLKDALGDFIAKVVFLKPAPLNINGVIEKIDQDNFVISVRNVKKGITYLVDIEGSTKTQIWEKGEGLKKSGFSQLKVGDRAHVNGLVAEDGENHLTALRILVLPGTAVGITEEKPTPAKAASPSPTSKAKPSVSPTP